MLGNTFFNKYMKGTKGFQKGHGKIRTEDSYKLAGQKISLAKIGKPNTKISGSNHYLWNGKTPLVEKIRKCVDYYRWRNDVFERDNYTCQMCNKRGGDLHVDHIKQLAFIIRDNKLTSFEQALSCGELWSLNNGRVLCKPCHRKVPVYSYDGTREVTFHKSIK